LRGDDITEEKIARHYEEQSKRYGYVMRLNEKNIRDWASYLMKNEATRDNAISLLETLSNMYPSFSPTFISLGDAYLQNAEKLKAKICYQKTASLDPKSAEAKKKLKEVE